MYPIDKKLVVAVSSNSLFDLQEEDKIFKSEGLEHYKKLQAEKEKVLLSKGPAFPFIKRLLDINKVYSDQKPIEVVLLSRNSPEIGSRIMHSIQHFGLDISRAVFTTGDPLFPYLPAFNVKLYLSTDIKQVKMAIKSGFAAGLVITTNKVNDDQEDTELRIAFDFDGVIADDAAEKIYKEEGLKKYFENEEQQQFIPHNPGPLADFFKRISYFQKMENKKLTEDQNYKRILKTGIITSRNAPAHMRAMTTLKDWEVTVDYLFLLGGIEKTEIIKTFNPHIFFDDQEIHLNAQKLNVPLVHIPFGVRNTN